MRTFQSRSHESARGGGQVTSDWESELPTAPGAQARGSHGASLVVGGLGAEIAPTAAPEAAGTEVVVVVVVLGDVEAVPVVPVAGAGADGALTANCEPVTTVTCAPSTTSAGSYAMTAEPDSERTTDSAAASVRVRRRSTRRSRRRPRRVACLRHRRCDSRVA